MKEESKFWKEVKKNTPKIFWTRLESWASFGVPDLLGYHDCCSFFMVELKVATGNKIRLSPHQILFHTIHPKRRLTHGHYTTQRIRKILIVGLPSRIIREHWNDAEKISVAPAQG